jgi:hypothetical protein
VRSRSLELWSQIRNGSNCCIYAYELDIYWLYNVLLWIGIMLPPNTIGNIGPFLWERAHIHTHTECSGTGKFTVREQCPNHKFVNS